MLTAIHSRKGLQLAIGLAIGIVFGFLLQKGGATRYDVIIGQLLLEDFTVVKIMLSAVLTGTILIHFLKALGLVQLHPKTGSFGSSLVGGVIFGVGFGLLGYCPGTAAGAVGQGSLDAIFGAVPGLLLGTGLFAALYPRLDKTVLAKGDIGDLTLPRLLKVNEWLVVLPVGFAILALLYLLERAGM